MNFFSAPQISKLSPITQSIIWSISLGSLFFKLYTGGDIFYPSNTAWIHDNDSLTSWLGWVFFRHTPLLQWPIGANWNYGMELGSAIVFSDSIPLLAIVFKMISFGLPATFQYFGLWIWLCFVLQIFWAQQLLGLYLTQGWLIRIASLLFAIAPVFIWRLHGHYALMGQWLILAALYLYLSKTPKSWLWALLLSLSALTQAYLLMMVLLIWGAYLIQVRISGHKSMMSQLLESIALLSITLTVMWACGYFMLKSGVSTWGFGFYRMNLLSLIDPDTMWSYFLIDQPSAAGDYEGFNYLGLGIIVLIPIALYLWFTKKPEKIKTNTFILLGLCIALLIYAVSNHIALGHYELLSYSIPGQWFQDFSNTFRNSGRFFWPVYYLIYLCVLVFICTRLTKPYAFIICLIALGIQIGDGGAARQYFYQKHDLQKAAQEQITSPLWSNLLSPYSNLIVILPKNQGPDWQKIALLAASNNKNVNVGYFARVDSSNEEQVRLDLANQVLQNQLSTNSLYLFEDTALWYLAIANQNPDDLLGILNGMRFLAPRFKRLSQESLSLAQLDLPLRQQMTIQDHQRIIYSDQGMGKQTTVYGWADPEALGTWSNGRRAALLVHFSALPKLTSQLTLTADAFVLPQNPKQVVRAWINGELANTWTHTLENNLQKVSLPIPKIEKSIPNSLLIEFEFSQAVSPSQLGLSDDSRRLGIRLKSIDIDSY